MEAKNKKPVKNPKVGKSSKTVEDLLKEIELLQEELKAASEKAEKAKQQEEAKVVTLDNTEVFDVIERGMTARTLRVGEEFWINLKNSDGTTAWYQVDPLKKAVYLTDPAVVDANEELITKLGINPIIPDEVMRFWEDAAACEDEHCCCDKCSEGCEDTDEEPEIHVFVSRPWSREVPEFTGEDLKQVFRNIGLL